MKLSELKKAKKALCFCSLVFVAVTNAPHAAHAGVAATTLTTVGMPLIQLLVLASFGWIIAYLLQALGQGQVAGMTKVIVVFSCLGIVIKVVWSGISTVAGFFGVAL